TINPIVSGCLLLALLAFLIAASRKQLDRYFGLLFFALVLSIVSSMIRASMLGTSIHVLEPFGSGQRYFFYAYIMLSFVLLWLAAVSGLWLLQLIPSLVLISVLLLSLVRAQWFAWPAHAWALPVDWRSELGDCARNSKSKLTIPLKGFVEGDSRRQ